MTATVEASRPVSPTVPEDAHLTFPRIVKSEWIKFRSLRSTVWALGITLVVMIGFALLMAWQAHNFVGTGPDQQPVDAPWQVPAFTNTFGYLFAQLVVAVLGVLVITGEYGTGMIRSTMTAVPKRIPALVAKYIVVGLTTFVVSVIALAASYFITNPILGMHDLDASLNGSLLRVLVGCALYLTAISLFGLGVGALMRHSAGAISTVLALLLLAPIILGSIPVKWANDIAKWLPSSVGERVISPDVPGPGQLGPWQGFGMLVLYVAVIAVAAAVLLRRRDV